MRLFNKRGQSATEYILVLGLMVALILVVGSLLKGRMKGVVDKAMTAVEDGIGKISGSSGGSGTTTP